MQESSYMGSLEYVAAHWVEHWKGYLLASLLRTEQREYAVTSEHHIAES
jgi:hypothetical protein